MRWTPTVMVAALCVAALASVSSHARAYCTVGQGNLGVAQYQFDPADLPAPVYLVASGNSVIGKNTSQVARAIGRAIDAMNRYGMSGFTLRFGGVIASSAPGQKGIFIRPSSNCNVCSGAAGCTNYPSVDGNGDVISVNVRLPYNQASCPGFDWEFYPDYAGCQPGACADDMQSVIMHELGHVAGLAHSGSAGNCTPGDNGREGMMSGSGNGGSSFAENRYPSRDDIAGLISLYGRRFATLDYHYSFDGGLSWGNGGLLGTLKTRSPLSSVSTATEGETSLFLAYHALDSSWTPYSLEMTQSSTSALDKIGGLNVFHPQPVAYGDGTLVAARFTNETRNNNSKALRWAWSTDDGNSWQATLAQLNSGGTIRTRRNGLAAAYDPKTARFVAAYVGDENLSDGGGNACTDSANVMCDELRVVTFDPATGEQRHTNLGVRTATAPSMACGDTSSWRNCVISWVSTTGNACVHWGHSRVLADGSFELYNDKSTGCYAGFSAPVVTYDDTEPSAPWRMAMTQEMVNIDDRIYTFRKGSSYNASWTNQRSFAINSDFRILGGLGFLRTSGGNEKVQVMYIRD